MNPVILTFLGTRGPYPGSDDLPSILVAYGKSLLVLDAGEGIQHRLHIAGRSVSSVSYILITHMHGDHILGLLPFLQSRSLAGARKPLTIIGPKGISSYLKDSFKYLNFLPSFETKIIEALRGSEDFSNFKISFAPLEHSIQTLGYRLDFDSISICYITDTRPCLSTIDLCKGVSVLIHDSAFMSKDAKLAREYGHSTALEAAKMANRINAGMLILYHISSRYKDVSALVHEARKVFPRSYPALRFMKLYITPKLL